MTQFIQIEVLLVELERVGFHVKDVGLLGSALERPKASAFGEDAYPTLERKAAALVESIVRNHPMIDGNKRTAWFSLNLFLELNSSVLVCTHDEAFDFLIGIATGSITLDESERWIASHTFRSPE